MSILRIKNQDGTWTFIPAIRGDRGPEGPQGPQGIPGLVGESGVHLGPDEPTDPAIRVWIDTSGTGANIQDYARRENVLTKSNQDTYIPQQPYNPATKDYVDNMITEEEGKLVIR